MRGLFITLRLGSRNRQPLDLTARDVLELRLPALERGGYEEQREAILRLGKSRILCTLVHQGQDAIGSIRRLYDAEFWHLS